MVRINDPNRDQVPPPIGAIDPLAQLHPPRERDGVLRLVVFPYPALAVNVTTGKQFELRYARIEHISGTHRLGLHKAIQGDPPSQFEFVQFNLDGTETAFQLPPQQQVNLFKYLLNSPGHGIDFKAGDFINYINDIRLTPGRLDLDRWQVEELSPTEGLAAGDVVIVGVRNPQSFQFPFGHEPHFAVCIGEGLTLSKFGAGNLIVATLQSLQLGFGPDTARLRKL